MQSRVITATEASRSLSAILNKVHYQGESFEIKRGREIIARIIPSVTQKRTLKISELNALFKRLPALDQEDAESFAKDIQEIRTHLHNETDSWD